MPKSKKLTDLEIVKGIQCSNDEHSKDTYMRAFYFECKKYFDKSKASVLGDSVKNAQLAEDLFHDSFVKLLSEISDKKIFICNEQLWRKDRHGVEKKMTAKLHTFLLSIAKNKNFEELRKQEIYGTDDSVQIKDQIDSDPEQEEVTVESIVMHCLSQLPNRCQDILTLFYYHNWSLDKILEHRKESQSKDALKTGKHKCMKRIKESILAECKRHNLKPCYYE